jgi:uncharacterized protein (DUF1697 family)
MPTHVALLRGVNVGGGNKLAMAELRQLVTSLGHSDVTTYIQSGNLVFTPSHADSAVLATELRSAIDGTFGINPIVLVLTSAELSEVVDGNPYKHEPEGRYVHVIFLPTELGEAAFGHIKQMEAESLSQGSRDELTVLGRALYLHTPDGFGTSELAKTLLTKRASPVSMGTARNWNTVTKLLTMCDG